MSKPAKHPQAYAWKLEDGSLCRWARPWGDMWALKWIGGRWRDQKPSPGATAQMVRLVPEGDYRKLVNAAKRNKT